MLEYASITNSGNRCVNEDSIGILQKENHTCFVLCDGLGRPFYRIAKQRV